MRVLRRLFGFGYKEIPRDDFIRRLPASVIGAGMLHPGNVYLMDWAIRNMPDRGSMVEIGTYGGLSTNLICHLARKHRREHPFFTCDPWVYEGLDDRFGAPVGHVDGRSDLSRTDYMHHIRESYIAATRLLSADRLPHTVEMTSAEFFALWERREEVTDVFGRPVALGGPIAFAYIDGDHAVDIAERDVTNVTRHLEPGGMVLLDDSADGLPFGSAAMMGAILTRGDLEVVARNPNYLLRRR